jgi:hypothetical protein
MLNNTSYAYGATQLHGRRVAHIKRNARQRAFLAADLVGGRVRLTGLTVGQAAALLKVSPTYVEAAIKATDDGCRLKVLRGYRPLVLSKPKKTPETLAARLARATPAERAAAAREVGVGAIWDSMIVPSLS